MEFRAELVGQGGAAGFVVPDEVVEALGGGRRPKVVVTLREHTWRSSIASMGGRFMLGVSKANREASGTTAGETYDVEVTLDEAPRTVTPPDDLAAAIRDAGLTQVWDALAFTHQKEHVDAVEGAKKAETRERRVEKCVAMLRSR